MNLKEFCDVLSTNPNSNMHWMFSDGSFVPSHYHITEVGKLRKDFVDCGGTLRSIVSCLLQVWVANDIDHRLETTGLLSIINICKSKVEIEDSHNVEIEFEEGKISQYSINGFEKTPSGLLFYLGSKHTSCLAPDKCLNKVCC